MKKLNCLVSLLLGAVLMTACGSPQRPTLLVAQVPPTISLITPGQQPVLPPTWTPMPSRTPIPSPTITLTPEPTLTLMPSPTLPAETICANFNLTGAPQDGVSIPYAGGGGFSWEGVPSDSGIILSLSRLDGTGEAVIIPFLATEGFNALFEASDLPGWGGYSWTLSIYIQPYGEICPLTGTFFREPWWNQPINNPLNPPFTR